jgi:hypothetical protein
MSMSSHRRAAGRVRQLFLVAARRPNAAVPVAAPHGLFQIQFGVPHASFFVGVSSPPDSVLENTTNIGRIGPVVEFCRYNTLAQLF